MNILPLLRIAALSTGLVFMSGSWAADAPAININTASAEEIAETLTGVGLAKARAIVEYREANGAFKDVYELENVQGIGARTVSQNEARIRVQ